MFPGGGPGVALLLIRVAVGAGLLLDSASRAAGVLTRCDFSVRIAVAAILLAGVLTPIFAVLAVALAVANLIVVGIANVPVAILVSLDAIALILLGPGAYSIDARRFGRRVLMTSVDQKSDSPVRKR
jgi:uncharacterized membrane protein YphA (DoxX/SURF4 family)